MKASYPEEFKRNTMAVIKTGYAINPLAKRLGIPATTIRNWIHHPDFAEVQPASEELLAALPTAPQAQTSALVPITKSEKKVSPVGEIKLKVGKMEMNLPQNFEKDSLVTIIKALGEAGVL